MSDFNAEIRGLVPRGLRSMHHVDVVVRLRELAVPMSPADIATLDESSPPLESILADLVSAGLVAHDLRANTYTYAAAGDDRQAIEAIAVLYSQWPETLARLFYGEPPKPLKSFSRAFRLRIDRKEDK